MDDELPHEVLRSIDTLLEDKPDKVGHDFSDATRRLSASRDALAERWRETHSEPDRRNLERVNAALSVVLGGQFPLGKVPWSHIQRARQDLAEMMAER
jgi:hypothetical protein